MELKKNLPDELAEVFTHQLTSRPIAHTVAVESVCGRAISFDSTKRGGKRESLKVLSWFNTTAARQQQQNESNKNINVFSLQVAENDRERWKGALENKWETIYFWFGTCSRVKFFFAEHTSGVGAQSKQTKQNILSRGELKVKSRCKSKQLPTSILRGRKCLQMTRLWCLQKKAVLSQFSQCVYSANRQIVPFCPLRRSLLVTGLSPCHFCWHYVTGTRVLIALQSGFIFGYSICELSPYLLHLCRAETT